VTVQHSPDVIRLRERVCDFYAEETELLDDGRYHEWLDLLADEIAYVMPMPERRQGPPTEADERLPGFLLYNEDKASLSTRVARLDTGLALVELPPALTQRLVTDVRIVAAEENSLTVRSSFLVYTVRDEANEDFFIGRRRDTLLVHGDTFRVKRREITLAQLLLPRSIALFF
jgi:3-phenylpropionate/cinnamic acid dioxygenase small subunit